MQDNKANVIIVLLSFESFNGAECWSEVVLTKTRFCFIC